MENQILSQRKRESILISVHQEIKSKARTHEMPCFRILNAKQQTSDSTTQQRPYSPPTSLLPTKATTPHASSSTRIARTGSEAKARGKAKGGTQAANPGQGHGLQAGGGAAQEEGVHRCLEEAAGRGTRRRWRRPARDRRVPGGAPRGRRRRERRGDGGVRGGVLRAVRVPPRGRALLRGARPAPRRAAVLRQVVEAAAPAAARAGGILVVLGRRGRRVPAAGRRPCPQAGNGCPSISAAAAV